MKLTRILAIPALLCLLLAASCIKKDDSDRSISIKGVNMRNVDANPAGMTGTPDVYTEGQHFALMAYPNPSIEVLAVDIQNTLAPARLRLKLISAVYTGAPAIAIIENTPIVGACLFDKSIDLPVTTSGAGFRVMIDVAKLPRGFYRLYAETDNGGLYWDNIWLMR